MAIGSADSQERQASTKKNVVAAPKKNKKPLDNISVDAVRNWWRGMSPQEQARVKATPGVGMPGVMGAAETGKRFSRFIEDRTGLKLMPKPKKDAPYATPDSLEAKMAIAAGQPTAYSSDALDLSDEEALGYGSDPFASVGGGRGGASPLDRYARALQSMIRGGKYGDGSQALLAGQTQQNQLLQDLLNQFKTQSEQEVNTSTGALRSMLESQQNPYSGLQARATNVAPELQQLLASQGADTNPLAQYAAANQQASESGANALNQLYQTLGANWQAGQQGAISDVEAQRQALLRGLGANAQAGQFSLQQQLAAQQQAAAESQAAQRQKYIQMLLNAASKGARVNLRGLM